MSECRDMPKAGTTWSNLKRPGTSHQLGSSEYFPVVRATVTSAAGVVGHDDHATGGGGISRRIGHVAGD